MDNLTVLCPKCGSSSITVDKKGFSAGKAIVGDLLVGPIGLLAGQIGSKEIILTCLNCGNKFKPGEGAKSEEDVQEANVEEESEIQEIPSSGNYIVPKIILVVIILIIVYYITFPHS